MDNLQKFGLYKSKAKLSNLLSSVSIQPSFYVLAAQLRDTDYNETIGLYFNRWSGTQEVKKIKS